ncbi:unnamed protein product [Rotaria sp. Silwood1]|nr:unnamed protein product [Rotaria sp. Silwood1]
MIEGELNQYTTYIVNNQLTPYCRRPDNDEKEAEISVILDDNIANNITFKELSEQGVTSEQLLNWSAPIDLVERYERNNRSSELFYNCSSPWFGSKCQYQFVYDSSFSFNEIVRESANSRSNVMLNISVTTCYRFLPDCHRGPWSLCLDWRQICNGKVDCMNGEDEQWCEKLEMNTCADDEYRCHYGGQCIPLIFARDSTLNYKVEYGIHVSDEYFEVTWNTNCEPLAKYCVDEWLPLPEYPVLYGYFQFVYLTNRSINEFKINCAPDFVCFDVQKCPILLSRIVSIEIIDRLTCCRIFDLIQVQTIQHFHQLNINFSFIYSQCSTTSNEKSCENSSYFHCNQSLKCISYNRVGDGFKDCFYNEDESFPTCHLNDSNRFMCKSDPNKCLLPIAIGNGYTNCPKGEDETTENMYGIQQPTPFFHICNTRGSISPANGIETYYTNCEWWPCNTPYTYCNTVWDCLNGIDELNCPGISCSLNEFECRNKDLNLTYCLPFVHMFHKWKDDCSKNRLVYQLYFDNGTHDISKYYYSFNKSKCISEDNICNPYSETTNVQEDVCLRNQILKLVVAPASTVHMVDNDNTYLCTIEFVRQARYDIRNRVFTPSRLGYFPSTTSTTSVENIFDKYENKKNIPKMDIALAWYCHYGVLIRFKGVNQTKACLCPPNYFGSQCQWQSQRVSLTLQFRMSSIIYSTVIYQLIIMLIDEQGTIAFTHEQIIYMPAHNCNTKFNIYLLYPHRPKHSSTNYSIRIDLFDKSILDYWTSWYLPIPFQFLPVNRISTQLIIPDVRENELCNLPCGEHGRCVRYTNMNKLFFCRCDQGYSGTFCNIIHQCQCSNDSLCLASSICVCPLNKFGSRCYLKRSICQSTNNPCQDNGLCIPMDNRINLNAFVCVCKEDYHGERCQYTRNKIDIRIDETMLTRSSSFFIHYIIAFDRVAKHEQITTLKKIAFSHHTITIYIKQQFNIIFIQIPDGDYYLTVLKERYTSSEYIHTQMLPTNRCLSVHDLLNETFRQYEYLRRIKYYPLLCRQYSQLMCFYEENYTCICDTDRFSNCFEFNRTIRYDCSGKNLCYNDGRCFLNNKTCPSTFTCVCNDCYYGDIQI